MVSSTAALVEATGGEPAAGRESQSPAALGTVTTATSSAGSMAAGLGPRGCLKY